MSTVVLVQRDSALIGDFAVALRAAGHEVRCCRGVEDYQCPILDGQRCAYCEDGDVLVYDPRLSSLGGGSDSAAIIGMLRWSYPRKPIVVADGPEGPSPGVRALAESDPLIRLLPMPTPPERVVSAVAEALAAT